MRFRRSQAASSSSMVSMVPVPPVMLDSKIMNLGEGLEAPRAMAAGLLQEKGDLVADQGHQAIPLVQGLNQRPWPGSPQLPEGLVSAG